VARAVRATLSTASMTAVYTCINLHLADLVSAVLTAPGVYWVGKCLLVCRCHFVALSQAS
jgi:hypothetical protein